VTITLSSNASCGIYALGPVLATTNTDSEAEVVEYALFVGTNLELKLTCPRTAGFQRQVLLDPLTLKFVQLGIRFPSAMNEIRPA
jgi:hypothetical protein